MDTSTAASTVAELARTNPTSYKVETPAATKELFDNAGYSLPEDFEDDVGLPTHDAAKRFYEYHQLHSSNNSPAWGDLSFQQQAKLVWLNIRGHDDLLVEHLRKILKYIPSH